jgi:predicted metal-dependent phosphoesterase TrpH
MLCDFHLHTTKSDGVWAPERLFDEIRRRELQRFSVTDHDCVDAYPVPEDLRERCIAGLEVDSHHGGQTVHVLAYGIGDPDCELLARLRAQRENRVARMRAMISRLQDLGVDVTIEDVQAQVAGASSLGRPHLARALVAKGCVPTVQEAFDRYIADEGEGFVSLQRLTSLEIIAAIHACGGVAVIAHPLRLRDYGKLEELCALGADGVELIHPTADPAAQAQLREFCAARGLLVTGGTDFHAPVPGAHIGVTLPDEDVEALQSAIDRRAALAAS